MGKIYTKSPKLLTPLVWSRGFKWDLNDVDYGISLLGGWDDFRTFRWIEEIEFPNKLLDDIKTYLIHIP